MIANADAARIPLPDKSVHCVVTSPPYFGPRKYKGEQARDWPAVSYSPTPGLPPLEVPAMRCELGREKTPEAYVAHLVLCFREVWRVLRDDGVCWVVEGDSYTGYHGNSRVPDDEAPSNKPGYIENMRESTAGINGLKGGNLLAIPYRLLLALQADGWLVRNDVVWSKVAPMPESVAGTRYERHRIRVAKSARANPNSSHALSQQGANNAQGARDGVNFADHSDEYTDCPGCPRCSATGGYVLRRGSWRHTRSHETVLMLTKGMGYYSDQERVRERFDMTPQRRLAQRDSERDAAMRQDKICEYNLRGEPAVEGNPAGRNPRDVVTPAPSPFSGPHYAAFPPDLIRPLILSSAPLKCCPVCGAGWAAVVERTDEVDPAARGSRFDVGKTGTNGNGRTQEGERYLSNVIGYRPTCACQYEGLPPDSFEAIGSPTGERTADDPSQETGRAGYNRPRGPDEGQSFSTRYQQREYAKQIKASPHRDEMASEVTEEAFPHYIRTDRAGARPAPERLLESWIARGWLERVIVPEPKEALPPVPGLVLDPFAGSGTTGLVCRELGLRFVGLDISGEYLRDIALVRSERLTPDSAMVNLPLFELLHS